MKEIFTVSFFGHRIISRPSETEKNLEKIISELIKEKEYVEFLIGRDGDFDLLAASVICRTVKKYQYGNTSMILVLPYMKAEYKNNEKEFLDYYDEVEICEESSDAYFKSAIAIRNKCMVERSDLVVCCIEHESGGAYKAVKYAYEKSIGIINVFSFSRLNFKK